MGKLKQNSMLIIGDDSSGLLTQLRKTIDSVVYINTKSLVFLLFDCSSSSFSTLDRYLKSYEPHNVFLFVLGETKDITLDDVRSFVCKNKLKGFLEVDITSRKSVRNAILFAVRRPVPRKTLPLLLYDDPIVVARCCCIL